MRPRFASGSCPNCDAFFERLPVECDEDGGYAVLEVRPCANPVWGKLLCACCDQFHCDGCGQTFCADHLVSVPDGSETPLRCCPSCAEDPEQSELPSVPQCPEMAAIWERGQFIDEIQAQLAAHRASRCMHCAVPPLPIQPTRETRPMSGLEAA